MGQFVSGPACTWNLTHRPSLVGILPNKTLLRKNNNAYSMECECDKRLMRLLWILTLIAFGLALLDAILYIHL